MAEVELNHIQKSFGSTVVIKDISLTIKQGEFVVLVGPSGSGKSTLLRMISGLDTVSQGTIHIDGKDVTKLAPSKRGLAMVFQSYALFPHLTVAENIGFGLSLNKVAKAEIKERVKTVAKTLQLDNLLERMPRQLSGGQRQRVAIGRSIIRNPKVFLFDEPLSNLDAALRVQMRLEIADLHKVLENVTMIYVTHDQVEAMTLADRIVVLNHGNVEQVGTPLELYNHPKNLFVAEFIGSPKMNFVSPAALKKSDDLTIGIRPEHISVSKNKGQWKGQVAVVEHLGVESFLHIQCADLKKQPKEWLIVRTNGESSYKVGDTIHITLDPKKIHYFDNQGFRLDNR